MFGLGNTLYDECIDNGASLMTDVGSFARGSDGLVGRIEELLVDVKRTDLSVIAVEFVGGLLIKGQVRFANSIPKTSIGFPFGCNS